MQLHQTFTIALLSSVLFACGSSEDGAIDLGSSSGGSTSTDTVDNTDTTSQVTSDSWSSFTYKGSTQSFIAIQGTGGVDRSESATLTFELLDIDGEPVSDANVTFDYNLPSGTSISPITSTTNSLGVVSTTISAGKVSGLATVNVSLDSDPDISVQSDSLSISTGLPDQDSFSISVTDFSPSAADHDGEIVGVTVRLADHWNNTVPDGTTVYFHTTAGKIQQSGSPVGYCTTVQGQCSMDWESSRPRLSDGTATITAWALGEESFTDKDNDGWFSEGDIYTISDSVYFNSQTDLGEVFFDINHNNEYDADLEGEEFVAFDTETNPDDQTYTESDGMFTGALCSDEQSALGNCSQSLVHVRMNTTIAMSSDTVSCRLYTGVDVNDNVYDFSSAVDITDSTYSLSSADKITVRVEDLYGNTPPTGTTIDISTENGDLSGTTSFTTGTSATISPWVKQLSLSNEDPNESTTGLLTVTAVTPKNSDEFTCELTVTD